MKYFQKQKNMYLWGRGIALVKEDVLKMLEFFEEALLLCQVDKDETKKFLVLMADFIEYSREWTNSDAVDLADVVDDFFVNGATIKDLLSSKAKITEPYELYKAVNEVKAHKDTLMCILLTRLCNHTFATVEAKESRRVRGNLRNGPHRPEENSPPTRGKRGRIATRQGRRQRGVCQRCFFRRVGTAHPQPECPRPHWHARIRFRRQDRSRFLGESASPRRSFLFQLGRRGRKEEKDAFRHYGSSSRGQRSQEKEKV
jgi:hypothetical protein